jgi:hypothetical protein
MDKDIKDLNLSQDESIVSSLELIGPKVNMFLPGKKETLSVTNRRLYLRGIVRLNLFERAEGVTYIEKDAIKEVSLTKRKNPILLLMGILFSLLFLYAFFEIVQIEYVYHSEISWSNLVLILFWPLILSSVCFYFYSKIILKTLVIKHLVGSCTFNVSKSSIQMVEDFLNHLKK